MMKMININTGTVLLRSVTFFSAIMAGYLEVIFDVFNLFPVKSLKIFFPSSSF